VFVWIVRYYEYVGYLVWLFGCENVTVAGENRGENW